MCQPQVSTAPAPHSKRVKPERDSMTTTILFGAWRLEGLSGWGFILWGLLFLFGSAFLVWTYRGIYERSGRRPLTWWLLGLRGAGILVLVLMLARPTWTREREEVEPGRVAVV